MSFVIQSRRTSRAVPPDLSFGQLMLDVAGTTLTDADRKLLADPNVGGVILFARNVETPAQVRALTDSIRAIKPNILLAVDQEGGRVARLRQGFTPLPAMGRLGAYFTQSPVEALSLAYACGYVMAAEVLAVGIDFSFAPVLDIDGISQVIGDRAFHSTPVVVTALSAQFMHGMHAAGMATTGKHFPGHGSVAPDSHVAQAVDARTFDEIVVQDMLPFIQNLPQLDALMPAHVIFSQVDDKPAGFSAVWLQDIIRKRLNFDGVLFSDDLSMQAAHVVGDAAARLAAALSAGCDMGVICNDRAAATLALDGLRQQNLDQPHKLLSPASQQRLCRMVGAIPAWQGDFQSTAGQLPQWQDLQARVADFCAHLAR